MNLRDKPFLRLIVPFCLGIYCGENPLPVSLPPALWAIPAVASVLLAFSRYQYRFRWVFGAVLMCCLFCGGFFLSASFNELGSPVHFSKCNRKISRFFAEVTEAPAYGARVKIPVRMLAAGDSLIPVTGNLILFLDKMPDSVNIRYGDRIVVTGEPIPTEPAKNPCAFDYARYLHFRNIHHQCFTHGTEVVVVSSGHGNGVQRNAFEWRDYLLRVLKRHFPTTDEYAVASALLVGFKDDLSDDMQLAYAETGSMHALAVSGTHVGMLYAGLIFMTEKLRLRGKWRRLETIAILTAIWAFTFLTGASASVLRASVMFTVYLLAKSLYRQSSAWNILPVSAFFLLLNNPYLLFDAGFQLSYAAVAGMVFFYPRMYRMFPPGPRWADEGLKVLLTGASAQLGTLPLSLFLFNQFPVYFWLSGWIVVLGGAIFLWGGTLLMIADAIWPAFAGIAGKGLYLMILYMNRIIYAIQDLPASVISGIWIPGWVAGVMYAVIFLLGGLIVWRRGSWFVAIMVVVALLGYYRLYTRGSKQEQRVIAVYHLSRQQRMIDFFDGNQTLTLSDSLTRKQEQFAAGGFRTASAIFHRTTMPLSDQMQFQSGNFIQKGPFIIFSGIKMAFFESGYDIRSLPDFP
ncbi:MAG: ComEC/Rec2 family competence protein, partial [Bacteroidota bacterium]